MFFRAVVGPEIRLPRYGWKKSYLHDARLPSWQLKTNPGGMLPLFNRKGEHPNAVLLLVKLGRFKLYDDDIHRSHRSCENTF